MKILFAFFALAAGIWYWQDSLSSREITLKHCKRLCNEHGLQFLDQSVHVARHRLGRSINKKLCIRRFYAFEFSVNGVDRHHGVAVVANQKLEYLSLLHPEGEIIEGALPTSQ